MYRFILSLTLVLLAGCCFGLYGQSTASCAASAQVSGCAKAQLAGKAFTASTTAEPAAVAETEAPAQSKPHCMQAGAQLVSQQAVGNTQSCDPTQCDLKKCDPKDCDLSKCDPADCDPSKCDLSKCRAKAAGASEASAKVNDQPATSGSSKAG